jgi:hypothetical protein
MDSLTGNAQCTRDARPEAPGLDAAALSVCALRPIHPTIAQLPKVDQAGGQDQNTDASNAPKAKYKYVHPLLAQPEWEIHRNKSATSSWQEHVVTWSYLDDINPDSDAGKALDDEGRGRATGDGSFVRSLLLGDVITVWAKARFGGWVNNVEDVKVEVYWAV